MFTTKVQVAHHDMQDFISNYQDIDKFLTYCQQCNNYNHKWSCPPLSFNPKTYLSQYKSIYLVAVQINYSEDTINSLTTKEEISTFTRKTLRKLKNEIATALLNLENDNTISLSSGGCSYCCKCSRTVNQPCKKPDKMHHSLDSFGVDLGKVMEDIFNIKLLWGLDKLPKYHVLIHALISNETISATTISDIISKNSV